jgi:Flp pilus assembly pilin Flp
MSSRARRLALGGRRLAHDARGASAVEYMILVGIVALLALHAFAVFGDDARTGIGGAATNLSRLGL